MTTASDTPLAVDGSLSTLLLLADGRFPAGGHAHSGGFEAAATLEGLDDAGAVEAFILGRLTTIGLVAAAFASAACASYRAAEAGSELEAASLDRAGRLDEELDARTPSPALRSTSRRLGRQLVRAGRAVWPHPILDSLAAAPGRGPHQPIALGAVAAAAGLTPGAAASAAAQDSAIIPATAAVRLLGLDPFSVHAVVARLSTRIDDVAASALTYAHASPADLPSAAGPLADIAAELHATWEVRLFAS
jgi:urease accessory protein